MFDDYTLKQRTTSFLCALIQWTWGLLQNLYGIAKFLYNRKNKHNRFRMAILLSAAFVTGCGYGKKETPVFAGERLHDAPCAQACDPVWEKKAREADSLAGYGYVDLAFDEQERHCFEKMDIQRPEEIDTIFYPGNESYPDELEWSFSVYKYSLDSTRYRKYVEAVSLRHAKGFYRTHY